MPMYTWTHRKGAKCRFSDPINLLFDNLTSLNALENDWLGQINPKNNKAWRNPRIPEQHQYLYEQGCSDPNASNVVSGSHFTYRFHVRLWDKTLSDGQVIGSAHYEKWAVTTHHVLSFEDAEDAVCQTFSSLPSWTVKQNTQDYRNAVDFPANDGWGSIIER